ncbi:MAG TPA: sulfatase [Terriglobales bacterium]
MLNRDREEEPAASRAVFGPLLALTIWFGAAMGLVEGLDLLLFQQINWENWGRTLHVDGRILWIAPLVDAVVCGFFAVLLYSWSLFRMRAQVLRNAVFVFTGLAVYDWLTATQRLYQSACILMAAGTAFAAARWFSAHREPGLKLFKRTAPWLVIAIVVSFAGVQGSRWLREHKTESRLPAPAQGAPNVLVIIVDTLRADHVSAYGYSRITTPHIDQLAREGVLFDNAISPSSWSLPAHVSLVTGLYPHQHGWANVQSPPLWGWGDKGLGGSPCVRDGFKNRGYRSAAFSANGTYFVANLGYARCFDHFEDYFYSLADAVSRTVWGTEVLRNYARRFNRSAGDWLLRFGRNFGFRKTAQEVNAEFFRWLDESGKQRPFVAYFNYLDVHAPYGGPPGYPRPAWNMNDNTGAYDAGVKYVDDQIGAVLSGLESRGLGKNTIVVVTADHGEALWQHGARFHVATLYRELVHVPLIIWWPGRVRGGIRIARPVSTTAIPDTISDLAENEDRFPGPSLTSLWTRPESAANWPYPLTEVDKTYLDPGQNDVSSPNLLTAYDGSISSVITPRWQFLSHSVHGDQLYDWVQDPEELHNAINTPEGKEAARGLKEELRRREEQKPK